MLDRSPRTLPSLGKAASNREETVAAIAAELGGDRVTLTTPDGAPVAVDAEIPSNHIQPRRTVWLPVLRDLVANPQEAWPIFERHERTGHLVVRRRHVTLYQTPDQDRPMLMVFQEIRGLFEAWTFLPVDRGA